MRLSRIYLRALHGFHLLSRPMTLGVRGAAFDAQGRVFLIRHTYVTGWHLPGGGVDPGETAAAAMRRELAEEGGLALLAEPRLFGVYFNRKASRRDHVLFYDCGTASQAEAKQPDREIADSGFFALDDLPEATTPATRRRLAELRGTAAPDPCW